jgi:thymidylate synthase ThyX
MAAARGAARAMAAPARRDFFRRLFAEMEFFDAPPREFELADATVTATVSAAAFAQLKRHRMATLLAGDYRPDLGLTVPPALAAAGLEPELRACVAAADEERRKLAAVAPLAADYLLTNAHRRPVLFKMNLRELYHFVRLRDDDHAQWDIRALAAAVAERVRAEMPLAAMLLCGKSQYAAEFERAFARPPRQKI